MFKYLRSFIDNQLYIAWQVLFKSVANCASGDQDDGKGAIRYRKNSNLSDCLGVALASAMFFIIHCHPLPLGTVLEVFWQFLLPFNDF